MRKNYKILVLICIVGLLNNNCGSIQKAFDPERKNGSEEFLVEKKSPLSMPPNFDDLPLPKSLDLDKQEEGQDIKSLIKNQNDSIDKETKTNEIETGLEELLLKKIKTN